jgi:transposase
MCALHEQELKVWTEALSLPGYEVVHVEDEPGEGRRFSIVPVQTTALCPDCGRPCQSFRQKRWIENVVDLPLGGRPVRLKVRVFQYECEHCGRVWTEDPPIVAPGTWATCRLVERAAELVRHSDVANAAGFFGIPEKTLERWYYQYVERQKAAAEQTSRPIRSIGIDELSLKKNTASSSP